MCNQILNADYVRICPNYQGFTFLAAEFEYLKPKTNKGFCHLCSHCDLEAECFKV